MKPENDLGNPTPSVNPISQGSNELGFWREGGKKPCNFLLIYLWECKCAFHLDKELREAIKKHGIEFFTDPAKIIKETEILMLKSLDIKQDDYDKLKNKGTSDGNA